MPVDHNHLQRFIFDMANGLTSAAISATVGAPLERIQVILQTQSTNPQIDQSNRYRGMFNCLRRIPKEQGILSFWRGNTANILLYPAQAVSFGFNDIYRSIFLGHLTEKSSVRERFLSSLAVGGAAGATALLCCHPFQLLHTRLAADVGVGETRQWSSLRNCLGTILKTDGIRGIYRGLFASLQGTIVYRGFYFGAYDTVRSMMPQQSNYGLQMLSNFFVAQCVTLGAGVASYPFYTVTRHLMMQSARSDPMYSGVMDTWKKIRQSEGIIGFYRGVQVTLVKGIGGSILLVTWDMFRGSRMR